MPSSSSSAAHAVRPYGRLTPHIRSVRERCIFAIGHVFRVRVRVGRILFNVGYHREFVDALNARNRFLEEVYGRNWKRIFENREMFASCDLAGWGLFKDGKKWVLWPDEVDEPIGSHSTRTAAIWAYLRWRARSATGKEQATVKEGVRVVGQRVRGEEAGAEGAARAMGEENTWLLRPPSVG